MGPALSLVAAIFACLVFVLVMALPVEDGNGEVFRAFAVTMQFFVVLFLLSRL